MLSTKSATKKRKRVKVVDGDCLKEKPLGILEFKHLAPTQEELDLQEAVFGFPQPTNSVQAEKNDNKLLAQLADDQLFTIDEPNQPENHPGDSSNSDRNHTQNLATETHHSGKTPVWKDESVNQIKVSLTHAPNRLKKLRTLDDRDDEVTITGEEYEKRLRSQFEKINPTPAWLNNHRQSTSNQQNTRDQESQFDLDLILKSTGDLTRQKITKKNRKGVLPKGQLQVERLRDANQAEPEKTKSSPISCIQFHPQSDLLFTGSAQSKRLSFFKIDGTHNPALHFVHTPDLPIQAAAFCPPSTTNQSSTVLITGNRPYFYSFDLQTCQCIKSPQGLFHKSVFSQSTKGTSLSHFKFSPQGNLVAFVGMNGLVELVDWSNNIGSSQVIHSLKSNNPIKSLAWARNGTELLTLGSNAEVSVWDLRMNKILASWFDDGGFNPTQISTTDQDSPQPLVQDTSYTAIGSQSGIVNLYSHQQQQLLAPHPAEENSFQGSRKPVKTIGNLTTSIHRLKFNPDGQVLGISSHVKKDALKLVHVQSGTVFSNWPTSNTPLGHVTDWDFNSTSSLLAAANNRGRVLLYSLKFWE